MITNKDSDAMLRCISYGRINSCAHHASFGVFPLGVGVVGLSSSSFVDLYIGYFESRFNHVHDLS